MNRMTPPLVRWSVSIACTAFLGPIAYAGVAGQVQFVNGNVQLSNASGQSRSLQKGDAVSEGDTLTSAAAASAQIRMQDGGLVAVRPETQLKFDQFVFNGKQDGTERSFFSLLKGGFRAITGLVGQLNKTNYRIVTPVATIGIRGTDHETFLIVPGSALAQLAPTGAYSKVNVGETTLTTNQGSINVTPNQMGFAAGLNQPPLVQPINTKVFTVAQTPAAPAPSAKKEDAAADTPRAAASPTEGSAPAGDAPSPGTQTASARSEEPAAAKEPAVASNSPTGNNTENRPLAGEAPSGTGPNTAPRSGATTPNGAPGALLAEPAARPLLRSSAVVDSVAPNTNLIPLSNTPPPPPPSTAQTTLTAPPTNTTIAPTTASVPGGTTVNLTTSSATTSSGQVIAVSDGLIAAQAQAAAAAALVAYTSAQSATSALQAVSTQTAALAPANTAIAVSAINAASSAIAAANATNTTVSALAPANLTTANANASTANSIATSIASQLAAAQTLYTAHGSYRDSSAGPALSSAQAANTALQTAATAVQDAATAVSNNNDLLALKKTLSQAELLSANPAFTDASASLGTANTSNTAFTTAQSAAASTNATHLANAQAATTAAQTAANAAQAAATLATSLQATGDLTGAQAQLGIAQTQLALAQTQRDLAATERAAVVTTLTNIQAQLADAQTAITNAIDQATTAQSHANTASSYLGIAQTAHTDAQTALTAASTGLGSISGNAATVASQSAVAAYHNPAVTRNVNAMAVLPVGSASSFNAGQAGSSAPVANTTVVLDGNGNLVEARNLAYAVQAFQNGAALPGSPIASADVKYTGGTAADTFKLTDNSIYGGRWMGATVTVSDNNSATTTSATPAASLWAVILPPALNYVPSLTGTTSYSKVAATLPVDAAGTLGTLNSATLSANFTTGTLDAGVNLTLGSGTMAGTFQLTATGMVIGPLGGFESSTASSATTACTAGVCSAGGSGYSSSLGGGLAGDGAASAGLLYRLWPTPMYPADPASNVVDGLVAFQAGTAPTVSSGVASYSGTSTAVAMTGSFSMNNSFIAKSGDLTLSGGAPITLVQRYAMGLGLQTTTLISPASSIPVTALSGGIKYGIWETVSSVNTSIQLTMQPSPDDSHSLSPLPVYMVGAQGYVDSPVVSGTNTGPLVGSFSYTPVLHVSKDSKSWTSSTATSASLSANFTTQTVDMALAGTTSGVNWSLSSNAMPLSFSSTSNGAGAAFSASSAVVKVDTAPLSGATPVCATCSADLSGAFVGQNYAGAIVQYALHTDSSNALDLNVGGLVAYDRIGVGGNPVVSNGVAAPTGGTVLATSWELSQLATPPVFDSGVLKSWSESSFSTSITLGGGSSAQTPVGSAGSGQIDWGIWGAGSTMAMNWSYPADTNELLWITAPEPTPVYLSQVLTSTAASYTLLGGDITTLSNTSHGSFDSASTSLTVNFSTQTVGLSLKASVNGHNWLASTSNAPLQFLNNNAHSGFYADSYRSVSAPGYLTVTVDGQSAGGDISGQLVGTDFNNAILKFNLGGMVAGPSYERVQGVAGFAASTANDASTPYRMLLTSISDPTASQPEAKVDGAYSAASRTVLVGSGDARKFDRGDSSIDFTSGTRTDTGSAVIDGLNVNWGRWTPGSTVDVTKRATGAVQSLTLAGGAHVITGPLMTAPVALPTTGTYSYTMAGSTSPTDHLGNAGTLNSASLSANFTTQTVDVGVNVTVAGTTLGASATGVPIQQRSFFMADSRLSGASNLAVGCSGAACGTTNQGTLVGGFAGANGKAAGVTYGFTKVGTNAGAVNGAVVFQRP